MILHLYRHHYTWNISTSLLLLSIVRYSVKLITDRIFLRPLFTIDKSNTDNTGNRTILLGLFTVQRDDSSE